MTISLCMIVKNEEDVLARCLESANKIADEIIVVDTGSTDRTAQIAEQFTQKVYHYRWIDDFAAARNFSFEKATMDYILWLDADDVILPEDQDALLALKQSLDPSVDIVMMQYHVGFDERGVPNFTYERERLLKRTRNYRWEGRIHEAIPPKGNILHSQIAITHRKEKPGDPDRNLRIFETILDTDGTLDPRQQYYYARELSAHGRNKEAIQWLTQFLDEGKGWVEDNLGACLELATCYFRTGDHTHAIQALTRSFLYDLPRPQACCMLASAFFDAQDYSKAIYWYQAALSCPPPSRSGFCQPDYWDFIPYIQLCVCFDRIGDRNNALLYHEKAKRLKPYDSSVKQNDVYFYG